MNIQAIITGVTGMVGEGVLLECLRDENVTKVLVINRKPCGFSHPKLTEIVHENFYDLSPVAERLAGYNACFFCLGVSSVGKKEDEYFRVTHTLTLHGATLLAERNPDMTFCYVSGLGTDGTEKGRLMWARVKGKTENDLMKLPFRRVFAFRPGFIQPTKGQVNVHTYYSFLKVLTPLLRILMPNTGTTMQELGRAMIHAVDKGCEQSVLEVKDIVALSK